ncbi:MULTISPECIES: Gfo/Idh/MocA family protein [Actinokineospora]|uniref:Oxidoreductase n=1 Tax=Actinokineospora fastidiosa TaxID=1816 RepID=A0A918GSW6_9PSEU|nr:MULTISPECIES: Gfo/Idh/MocA family oxidoreductase [Actinokineospora]UVS78337.1 1,5-anhydro-D-fructose reductase [Actinokineospora sp. UTMC 2448]GGS59140.1 putative oxidoreductase [Actinokineospora fastidiosa]
MRWGILGAGLIAGAVGADIAASPSSEVAAVGARDLDRARKLADRLGAPRAYGSYAELVADPDLDVVYVATTHAHHHEHALLAIEAGKNVLVEKAFTLTAMQAQEVVAAAAARDVFCMEAMWMRMNPLVRRALEMARGGSIGRVLSVTADHGQRFAYDPKHRLFDLDAGGGALLDLGVYPATFAWMFLGAPTGVATTGHLSPTGSDATLAMQWSYDDDRHAHVACTTEAQTPCQATVIGTEGWLRVGTPLYRPCELTVHTRGGGTEVLTEPLPGNGYGPQVAEVERCLRAGLAESPLVPLSETVAIMGLMDRARADLGVRYPADG